MAKRAGVRGPGAGTDDTAKRRRGDTASGARALLPLVALTPVLLGGCSLIGLGGGDEGAVASKNETGAGAAASQPATKPGLAGQLAQATAAFAAQVESAPAATEPSTAPAIIPAIAEVETRPTTMPVARTIVKPAVTTEAAAASQPAGGGASDNRNAKVENGSGGTLVAAMAPMTAGPAEGTGTVAGAAAATRPSMETLMEVLRERAKTRPGNLSYALALQLIESAEGGKGEGISGLAANDQKLIGELAAAVQTLSATPSAPGSNAALAERAGPIIQAVRGWETEADLKLPRMALCSRVDSFGVYTPMEGKFAYGQRHVVILYCEVANFTSKPAGDKGDTPLYQTRLAQQDTLITDDGLLVWRPNPEEIQDLSRNQRHDFYLVKKITLPENLAIGKYTLRLVVTDKLSNKIATATMAVEIVGK